jgi:hypothetical protein
MGGDLTESRFDSMTFGSDIMLDYQLSKKLKLIGSGKFNHLIITLTNSTLGATPPGVKSTIYLNPCRKTFENVMHEFKVYYADMGMKDPSPIIIKK